MITPTLIAGVVVVPPAIAPGATVLDYASPVAVGWAGTQAGQDPNPMVPTPYTITAKTHPLATVFLKNPGAGAQNFTVDMFIATQAAPTAFAAAAFRPIPYQSWPGVLWDWSASRLGGAPANVVVPGGTTVAIGIDWPQQVADGSPARSGQYWAVVDVTAPPGLAEAPTPEVVTPIILSK